MYNTLKCTFRSLISPVIFVSILIGSLLPVGSHAGLHLSKEPLKSKLPPAKVIPADAEYIPTVLVTGSNRGIGLELVKQFAANGWNVIATARKPQKAIALNKLAKGNDKFTVVQLDVTNADSIAAMAKILQGQPIDVLLNNAGVYGNKEKQNIDVLDASEFELVINVNALGPLKVSQALLPNIRAGQQKKILAMGSGLGSMAIGGRRGGVTGIK
ncbi:SDR family NAD(P)-dependent oxidoreductase [Oceanicoccus sp. KOV_DT_Chl]|uniref:SDR family NAD(P)-dependent oxidoreductase n=1 Tax=Oceanicoccus sp. KOV_DT_Chl TaxID=1904639 RepID=UPI000C7C700E|nr:SDR family NAD(P)-dependent oxidoreductase [Oceanicoccus sp. KOV_DT_Chl]